MSYLSVIVPTATENLCTNPSVETNTTGWAAVAGAGIAQSDTEQKRGRYGLQVSVSAADDGCYWGTFGGILGATYTASVDVKGQINRTYSLYFATAAGVLLGTATTWTATGTWERQYVTHTFAATAAYRVYVLQTSFSAANSYYVDGLQVERQSIQTTYCDGDTAGCWWTGEEHASTSIRSASCGIGGTVIDLSDDYEIEVDTLTGMGMPPFTLNQQSYAGQPGGLLQSVKVEPRVIMLRIHTDTTGKSDLYTARAYLVDAIKPDRVPILQPLVIQFSDAEETVEAYCFYEAGLEGEFVNYCYDEFVLRLLSFDPFWYTLGNTADPIDYGDSLLNMQLVIYKDRTTYQWDRMGPPDAAGSYTGVYAVAVIPNGDVFFGGTFTNFDNDADSDYIVMWDRSASAWVEVAGGLNGTVYALAVDAAGDVWVGGDFTRADPGGVNLLCNGLAKYDVSAGTWSAPGIGTHDQATGVGAIVIGLDGTVYAGGGTDQWNSVGPIEGYIAQFDGTNWSEVDSGMDAAVWCLERMPNGDIVAGGSFTAAGSVTAYYIAKYDISAAAWVAIGDGFNNTVRSLAVTEDGKIYAGGAFTTDSGGDYSLAYIAAYDGATWNEVGGGGDATVYALEIAPDGLLYAGGECDTYGDLAVTPRGAIWNGYTWAPLDVSYAGWIFAYAFDRPDPVVPNLYYIYVGGFGAGVTATAAGLTTCSNDGSSLSYPWFEIRRSGGTSLKLKTIRNETTGKVLYFDLDILDGERIYIDLRQGVKKAWSSWRGSLTGEILQNSDVSEFVLVPGDNKITCLMEEAGGPTVTMHILWRTTHWDVSNAE